MIAACVLAAATALGGFSVESRLELAARVREALAVGLHASVVTGTVTYAERDFFFVQDGRDALKVTGMFSPSPAVGMVVAAEGVAELEGGRVVMALRRWWPLQAAAELPASEPVGGEVLVDPLAQLGGGVNWRRVTVAGRAIERTESGFAIDADGVPVTVNLAEVPAFVEDCGRTRPWVEVTGVVESLLDQSSVCGREPYVLGVRLFALSSADVILRPDIVYLANLRDRRIMAVVALVIGLLTVGLVVFAAVIIRQRRRHFRTQTLMAERKRMADDIHDTIEQHLVGAGMLVQLGRGKEAQEVLKRAKQELRDIIWGLKNDDLMRLGPAELLRQVAEALAHEDLLEVATRFEGFPERMEAATLRDLSLIVREAIGNAAKHGGARRVEVTGAGADGVWRLAIANDGAPFDPAAAAGAAEGHFGLEGMRERARRIGARFRIGLVAGKVTVEVEGKT